MSCDCRVRLTGLLLPSHSKDKHSLSDKCAWQRVTFAKSTLYPSHDHCSLGHSCKGGNWPNRGHHCDKPHHCIQSECSAVAKHSPTSRPYRWFTLITHEFLLKFRKHPNTAITAEPYNATLKHRFLKGGRSCHQAGTSGPKYIPHAPNRTHSRQTKKHMLAWQNKC